MSAKRTGLGRGLDALLGDVEMSAPAESAGERNADGLASIAVDLLQRGAYQPRQDMRTDALEELAASIRTQGVVQPIVVRPLKQRDPSGAPRYEIVAGERRWRAAQLAGLDTIPAIVREIPDSAAIAVALIENIQREDLNPLEEAQALRRLIDEFELTHQEAGDAIGRSRTAVSNLLRLLDLNSEARKLLQAGELEMGHARALLAVADGRKQAQAALTIVRKGLSVREAERLVKQLLGGAGKAPTGTGATRDPDIRRLQDDLADRLGARVTIQHSKNGRGKLVVTYNSLDELDGILSHIQ
jgi:ParB family chromosome partitioning protein